MRLLNHTDKKEAAPVRARRRRRLHRRLVYAGCGGIFAALLAGGGWYLNRDGMVARALAGFQAQIATTTSALHLTVQSVEVEGRDHTARRAILAALNVQRGTPILSVDLGAAEARIESLPWVHSAAVERMLPNTIFVRLVERRPLAIWQHHDRFDVIDQSGSVIPTARAADFPALLQVVGNDAPPATAALIEILASEPDLARHVSSAERIGGRRWNLNLDNGIEVELPEDAPNAAWHRLAALDRHEQLLEREIQVVDMRLPDRLVLRLSPDVAKSVIKKNRQAGPNT